MYDAAEGEDKKSWNVSSENTGIISSNFRTGIPKTEYINPTYISAILPDCLQKVFKGFWIIFY